jgi:DNA-binding transcriptional ArsR family regulator
MASMTPHVAEITNLVGDLSRATILLALMDDRALTAKELAHAARVSPQTTSSHLVKLTNAKLLQVAQQGRHRYYRLASPLVAQMLETVMAVAGDRLSNLRPLSKASEELRAARTCYDHLAGRLGVAIAEALTARAFIIMEPEGAELTP